MTWNGSGWAIGGVGAQGLRGGPYSRWGWGKGGWVGGESRGRFFSHGGLMECTSAGLDHESKELGALYVLRRLLRAKGSLCLREWVPLFGRPVGNISNELVDALPFLPLAPIAE